jgi:hypothetical protein
MLLSLLQKLMADCVVVKRTWPTAQSDLLLVQVEAQYILVTINNMVSVGVVENNVASYL